MAEPALIKLKLNMLQEIPTTKALKTLETRTLGFSQLRLLPKNNGTRPIINLRRRINKVQNGKCVLGRSINSVMQPVFDILNYKRAAKPASNGSALLSVGDLHLRLKAFRHRATKSDGSKNRFYFAKCDVQACFDTLPQNLSVALSKRLLDEDEYVVSRHAEIKSQEGSNSSTCFKQEAECGRRFVSLTRGATDFRDFCQIIEQGRADGKKNTIFVDGVSISRHKKDAVLALLEEHVESNMLKIGKKYYRQKAGIPQGSVLSSLLCDLIFAKLEKDHLSFLEGDDSLLLRLVDDFLLITADKRQAEQFLALMHAGFGEFGVQVNPKKSLANFEATANEVRVPVAGKVFPYCGILINTSTLEITKDRLRRTEKGISLMYPDDAQAR